MVYTYCSVYWGEGCSPAQWHCGLQECGHGWVPVAGCCAAVWPGAVSAARTGEGPSADTLRKRQTTVLVSEMISEWQFHILGFICMQGVSYQRQFCSLCCVCVTSFRHWLTPCVNSFNTFIQDIWYLCVVRQGHKTGMKVWRSTKDIMQSLKGFTHTHSEKRSRHMHVCMVCTCVSTHTCCTCMCVHVCMHVVYLHTCMHVCCVFVHLYVCMWVVSIYVSACEYIYI